MDNFSTTAGTIVSAFLVFLVYSYVNQYGTEAVKKLLRSVLGKMGFLGDFLARPEFGYLVALLGAFLLSASTGVNLVEIIPNLDTLPPETAQLVNWFLIAMGSNAVNDGAISFGSKTKTNGMVN